MSMMARFVQVTPDLLRELRKDSDRVTELFMAEPQPRARMPILDKARQEALLRRAPQALAASMAGMDPRIRERLDESLKRLGTSLEDLQSGKNADVMAQLMARGAGILGAAAARSGAAFKGKGADISLDKAWHGVHYLLCGEIEPGSSLISQAVLGGSEIGDDDSGYGPARVLTPQQVADIAGELNRANLETEMKARFDPQRMNSGEIYPGGWDTAGALDWILEEFHHLKDFYTDASARQFAIVTCIV